MVETQWLSRAAWIKARNCWGERNGLLSTAEVAVLMQEMEWCRTVLEVGHYYGLSTYALYWAVGDEGTVVTVDAHVADPWVKTPAPREAFEANWRKYFREGVVPFYMPSQCLTNIDGFTGVFYDGDHGAEQARFTDLVIASRDVRVFVFDDRDFEVPAQCAARLREAGWQDCSPPLFRGPGDKANEDTMTLGVFIH